MGSRADAGILAGPPIDQVVPTFAARPRVIGNFIRRQSETVAGLLRRIVQRARFFFGRDRQFAGGMKGRERGVEFDSELLERQMFRGFGYGAREFFPPSLNCLSRPGVDEVERIAVED